MRATSKGTNRFEWPAPSATRTPGRKAFPPPSGPATLQIERAAPERHLTLLLVEHENAGTLDLRNWHRIFGISASGGPGAAILDGAPEMGGALATLPDESDRFRNSTALKHLLNALVAAWIERAGIATEVSCGTGRGLLSEREGAILKLISDGLSNKEIARNLSIAPETVKSHVKRIFMKLNAESRAQAVTRAQSLGLLATRRAHGFTALPMVAA